MPTGNSLKVSSPGITEVLMPKTRPLSTGAELNLGNRVMGEAEKNNFIVLQAKGDIVGSCPSKLCVPTRKYLVRSFTAMLQGWGCCKDQDVCRACNPITWPLQKGFQA